MWLMKRQTGMTPNELDEAVELVVVRCMEGKDLDWTAAAGSLEWTCRQTLDHTIDCVFSYGLQLAALSSGSYLPFTELHALPEATPADLVTGLKAVSYLLSSVARRVSADATASDGVLDLTSHDWCSRAAYEVLLHGHDVAIGLGLELEPPRRLCSAILSSDALWMFDRTLGDASDPWIALLRGSGR